MNEASALSRRRAALAILCLSAAGIVLSATIASARGTMGNVAHLWALVISAVLLAAAGFVLGRRQGWLCVALAITAVAGLIVVIIYFAQRGGEF
jgi:hypothetical protein